MTIQRPGSLGKEVADQLRRLVENQKNGSIAVLVQRNNQRIYIPIKLG